MTRELTASRTRRSVKYYKEEICGYMLVVRRDWLVRCSPLIPLVADSCCSSVVVLAQPYRAHPPTIEELQADVLRQQKVQHNAALIEAKEQHERQEALRIGGGVPPAISDSDHRAEPYASHEAIHPQRSQLMTSNALLTEDTAQISATARICVFPAADDPFLRKRCNVTGGQSQGCEGGETSVKWKACDEPARSSLLVEPREWLRYHRTAIPTRRQLYARTISLGLGHSSYRSSIDHPQLYQNVDSPATEQKANGIHLEASTELVLDLEEAGEDEGRCGYYLVTIRIEVFLARRVRNSRSSRLE
ncbi:hypothetical protein IMY05_C4773000100 [Salix suchowensis]|nr:hypothetical protein IMY05_C4773000100 [Salix suchowensis]